jgi:hypothetical protein
MIALATISIIGLVVALILAVLVYFVAMAIGAPQIVAALLAVLVFLVALTSGVSIH